MAVRYTIPFNSDDNQAWRIDISDASLTSTPISLRGVRGNVGIISYDGEGNADDPYTVLFPSTLSISIYNQDNIDVNELQNAQDRDFTVSMYNGANLKWTGYLKIEGIQRQLLSAPTTVNLEAIDGLSMLADIDYTHADLLGGRCPINYFRQILFSPSNLGIPLPIRWTNTLQCSAFLGEDVFSGSVEWAVDNQGFYSYQASQSGGDTGQIKKCGDILEEMLRSMQCRISQCDGKWVIRRINDIVSGTFDYKQVAANFGPLVVSGGYENVLKQIGRSGYQFQGQDALITTKQGIKTVKVEYEANVRENVLPNGSQDTEEGSGLKYWGFYGTGGSVQIGDSLDGRNGHSAFLLSISPTNDYYTLKSDGGVINEDGLPIDTQTLVKVINFSFLFSPVNGFPSVDNVIVWDTEPFKIRVIFNVGIIVYYLNQFGFWQTTPTDIPIVIPGLAYNEVAKVDFDKFRNIIMPMPLVQPAAGDTSDIVVEFLLKPGQQYRLDNISVSVENANDVYESTYIPSRNTTIDPRTLKISSSFGGYMISNFMTNWSESDAQCYFRDGLFYDGTLTGLTANSMMRFLYKASKIFNGTIKVRNGNWSFDQIYMIDSFGTEKYLPLNAKYNVELCTVTLIAMECRNDEIELTEKYYSSNDKQLSN